MLQAALRLCRHLASALIAVVLMQLLWYIVSHGDHMPNEAALAMFFSYIAILVLTDILRYFNNKSV